MWRILVERSMKSVICLVLFSSCSLLTTGEDVSDGVVLLHVVHRHGARTRDNPSYPTDPYYNETFWPFGIGELTNEGKRGQYEIGRSLRRRYNKFLGSVYVPEVVDVRSTNFNRTKMSVALSLAGLFPPTRELQWNKFIPWTPIPYNYEKPESDYVLGPIASYYCPLYTDLLAEYLASDDAAALFEEDRELVDYLSEHTGWDVTSNPFYIMTVYYALKTEEDWGLTLPSWTKPVWEEPLARAAGKSFYVFAATRQMKRLQGGFFLKKVLTDTINKINGTLNPQERKLFLYSAHDANVANILNTLDLFDKKLPKYSSYIIIEVRLVNGVYGLQIFYQNYEEEDPILLTVPGCTSFCPLDKFVELVADLIPESEAECDV